MIPIKERLESDVLIVGGGITGQADKRATALAMKKIMNQYD